MPAFDIDKFVAEHPNAKPVQSTVKGTVIWQYDVADVSQAPNIGTQVKTGDTICTVEAYYGLEDIKTNFDGKIIAVFAKQGARVNKGEIIAFVE